MKLPCRLTLSRREIKQTTVLALDTGFDAESLEGLRLVKASRGSGWFFDEGTLKPWVTKGVTQDEGRLVVWGELDAPQGDTPDLWPSTPEFLRAFAEAWTARAALEQLPAFGPSSVVPLAVGSQWAFAFLPPELSAVLDSMQPLAERLPWDHVRHPDLGGEAGWAFTSAALSLLANGPLPWEQDDEAHLRQEIRELRKTLRVAELPDASAATRRLWLDSLKGAGTAAAWRDAAPEAGATADGQKQREAAAKQRAARRGRGAFWRRRGTLVTVLSASAVLVLGFAASLLWGWLKPDPTDTWTPEQVVRGYYQGLSSLDGVLMRKLAAYDRFREPSLVADIDQASSLYVLKQVRTAYEKLDPIFDAASWEAEGKPDIRDGRQLYGLAGVTVEGQGDHWMARYRRWVSEGGGGDKVTVTGTSNTDTIKLVRTGRGWKISSLTRQSEPLP